MPKVGNKEFPYTQAGVEAAQNESKTTGIPVTNAANRSQNYQIGGIINNPGMNNPNLTPDIPVPNLNPGMYQEGGGVDLEQYVEPEPKPKLKKDKEGRYYTEGDVSGHRTYYDTESGEKKTAAYKGRKTDESQKAKKEVAGERQTVKKEARKDKKETRKEKRRTKKVAWYKKQEDKQLAKEAKKKARKEKRVVKRKEKDKKSKVSSIESEYKKSAREVYGDRDAKGEYTSQYHERVSSARDKADADISALDKKKKGGRVESPKGLPKKDMIRNYLQEKYPDISKKKKTGKHKIPKGKKGFPKDMSDLYPEGHKGPRRYKWEELYKESQIRRKKWAGSK